MEELDVSKIKNKLSKNKLSEVIDDLKQYTDSLDVTLRNSIMLIEAQLEEVNSIQMLNTESSQYIIKIIRKKIRPCAHACIHTRKGIL